MTEKSLDHVIRNSFQALQPALVEWPWLAPALHELGELLEELEREGSIDQQTGRPRSGRYFLSMGLALTPTSLAQFEPLLTGSAQFADPGLSAEWERLDGPLHLESPRYRALQAHAWFLALRGVVEAALRLLAGIAADELASQRGLHVDPVPRLSTRFAWLAATRAELEHLVGIGPEAFGMAGILARTAKVASDEHHSNGGPDGPRS